MSSAIPIVGTMPANPWVGPNNPLNSGVAPIPPGTVQYSLSALQAQFIRDRMVNLGFGVDDVRLGLSVVANGLIDGGGTTDIGSDWDFQGPAVVPSQEQCSCSAAASRLPDCAGYDDGSLTETRSDRQHPRGCNVAQYGCFLVPERNICS